jgi:hypothetical protein
VTGQVRGVTGQDRVTFAAARNGWTAVVVGGPRYKRYTRGDDSVAVEFTRSGAVYAATGRKDLNVSHAQVNKADKVLAYLNRPPA